MKRAYRLLGATGALLMLFAFQAIADGKLGDAVESVVAELKDLRDELDGSSS